MKGLTKFIIIFTLVFTSISTFTGIASAHPGRTDKNGGHTCKTNCAKYGLKNGEYHLHKNGTIVRVDQKTKKPLPNQATTPVKPSKLGIKPNAKVSKVKIIRVVDGDTVEVQFNDKNKSRGKVRFIGVNTPESTTKIEYYGKEASSYTKNRLLNKVVTLEFDAGIQDRYGRYLAYIWVGKELFNESLVKKGYANVMTIQPNVKYQEKFIKGERFARQHKLGLWK